MGTTKIEWCEKTWNPVTGCTKVSPGCANCYAERMSKRLAGRVGYPAENPFKVALHPERLDEPLKWKKPSMIFVCSMGDLFHEDVPPSFIFNVFSTMEYARQHIYLVLTKRPERIKEVLEGVFKAQYWPNVWLGVTAENQKQADKRIPILLQIPAAKRFVSIEPMLGPVDLRQIRIDQEPHCEHHDALSGISTDTPYGYIKHKITDPFSRGKLDWVICGGESGPGARPMRREWARELRDQCQAAGVPFLFKQWGEYAPNWINDDNGKEIPGTMWIDRMGKKAAGRLLDGQLWDQYPEVRS